jgi:formate/nitrite transporter FocA (FNT family)
VKKRYLTLGLVQLLLIFLSAWQEIEFADATWNPSAQLALSFYCLAGWLIALAIAIWFAAADRANRTMLVLFLVLLLPAIEFFAWFALSF